MVKIDVLKGKTPEYKKALLDGIHASLMEAFGIPAEDQNMRIYEWEPENFLYNSRKSPCYTLIEINAFKGRSREAKKKLYELIKSRLGVNPGVPASDILIFIHEISLENWGIRGLAGDEIELGFSLQV